MTRPYDPTHELAVLRAQVATLEARIKELEWELDGVPLLKERIDEMVAQRDRDSARVLQLRKLEDAAKALAPFPEVAPDSPLGKLKEVLDGLYGAGAYGAGARHGGRVRRSNAARSTRRPEDEIEAPAQRAREGGSVSYDLLWCGVGRVKGSPFPTIEAAEAAIARLDSSARAAKQPFYGHYEIKERPPFSSTPSEDRTEEDPMRAVQAAKERGDSRPWLAHPDGGDDR